jgi:hypothetical protein
MGFISQSPQQLAQKQPLNSIFKENQTPVFIASDLLVSDTEKQSFLTKLHMLRNAHTIVSPQSFVCIRNLLHIPSWGDGDFRHPTNIKAYLPWLVRFTTDKSSAPNPHYLATQR